MNHPIGSKEIKKEVSTVEGLTFPSRVIHLFPETFNISSDNGALQMPKSIISGLNEKILISDIILKMGLIFRGEWRDPYVGYQTKLKKDKSPTRSPIIKLPLKALNGPIIWDENSVFPPYYTKNHK